MTPEQALSILDQVCAKAVYPRQDHATMVQAIGIINDLIQRCKDLEQEAAAQKEE